MKTNIARWPRRDIQYMQVIFATIFAKYGHLALFWYFLTKLSFYQLVTQTFVSSRNVKQESSATHAYMQLTAHNIAVFNRKKIKQGQLQINPE